MLTNQSKFAEVLKILHVSREEPDCTFDCYSEILAKSLLVEKMHAKHDAINAEAGQNLLYEELYLQPNRCIRRYDFERGGIDYHMSLSILRHGPTVIFSSFKSRNWIERLTHPNGRQTGERRVSDQYELLIDPPAVSNADLEHWFTYLRSGLRRTLKPESKVHRLPYMCSEWHGPLKR
jgi:hypothetical protein